MNIIIIIIIIDIWKGLLSSRQQANRGAFIWEGEDREEKIKVEEKENRKKREKNKLVKLTKNN